MINPARLADLPDLLNIEEASFLHPWPESAFLEEIKKSPTTLYVLRNDPADSVSAYICFWQVADEIQLMNLAVHPAQRQRGTGRSLMAFLLERAKEMKVSKVFLEVRPSNLTALALYRSLGFQVLYRRPGYYGPEGEDALVMEWAGE